MPVFSYDDHRNPLSELNIWFCTARYPAIVISKLVLYIGGSFTSIRYQSSCLLILKSKIKI